MAKEQYFIGIDVGATVCKAVAINSIQQNVAGKAIEFVQGNPEGASLLCVKLLSKILGEKLKILKKSAIATGMNSDKISIKNKASEITCIGAGVYEINSDIRIAVDVGSFSTKALKMDEQGKIKDFLVNDRCAAGSGVLLELVAEGLEMKVEDLSDVAFQAKNPITISSQCSIFAESEVISYKNEGADIADLIAGVCNSVAGRIYPLVRKLDKDPKTVTFTGGVAKCKKVAENLEDRLNLKLIDLPIEPECIGAYGAAILAKRGGVA